MITRRELEQLCFPLQPAMQPGLQPLLMSVDALNSLRFCHHATHCSVDSTTGALIGVTVWVASTKAGRCAAISFDFVEIQPGVLSIRNPLAIHSNVYLTSQGDDQDSGSERIRALMGVAYLLKWQSRVKEEIPTGNMA